MAQARSVPEGWGESARRHAPVVLVSAVLLTPVLFMPGGAPWHGMRAFLLQAVSLGLLWLLLTQVTGSPGGLRRFLSTGPNLPLLLLVGWAAISFVLTAPRHGLGRNIALVELMRMASGALIFFGAGYLLRFDRQLVCVSLLLLGSAILSSVAGLASYFASVPHLETAAYGNSQLLGAYLVLQLPAAVVFSQLGERHHHRVLAWIAVEVLVIALLLTMSRSAWLGSLAGLLATASVLRGQRGRLPAPRRRHRSGLVMAALISTALFLPLSGAGTAVVARAKTLTRVTAIGTIQWRLRMWSVCAGMIRDRPVAGWGVGSFPLHAGAYSPDVPSAALVQASGVTMSSLAHNEYLHLTAELGLIGLMLYLAVLIRFFSMGFKALARTSSGPRKSLLIASLGAIAGQCVDALANPGWRCGDVSPAFWLMLGLGMVATRP
jgi:O-antigen ligase